MNYAKRMGQKIIGLKRKRKKIVKPPMNAKSQKAKTTGPHPTQYGCPFYAEDQLSQMRVMLPKYWAERLDGEVIESILLGGNEGYENLEEESLIQEFESIFGENYFAQD